MFMGFPPMLGLLRPGSRVSGAQGVALALQASADLLLLHERVGDRVAEEEIAIGLGPLVGRLGAVLAAGGEIGPVLGGLMVGAHPRGAPRPPGRPDGTYAPRPLQGGRLWAGSRMCWRSMPAAPARGPSCVAATARC